MPGTLATNQYGSGWPNSGPTDLGSGRSFRTLNIDEMLWNISPAQTPFLLMLNRINREETPNPRYDWMNDWDFNLRTFKANLVVLADDGATDCVAYLKLPTPAECQALEAPPYFQTASDYDTTDMIMVQLTVDHDADGVYDKVIWLILEKAGVEQAGQWRTVDAETVGTVMNGGTALAAAGFTTDPTGHLIMLGFTDGAATWNPVSSPGWHNDATGSIINNEAIIIDDSGAYGTRPKSSGSPSEISLPTSNAYAAGSYSCYVRVFTPDMFDQGYAEGSGFPQESHRGVNTDYGHTEIFKTPYSMTRTGKVQRYMGGSEWLRKRVRKARQHKLDMEQAFIFRGAPSIDSNYSDSPTRTTGGLGLGITDITDAGYIRTHNPDLVSGATTHADTPLLIDNASSTFFTHLNDALELLFDAPINIASEEKLFYGSRKWATLFFEATRGESGFRWVPDSRPDFSIRVDTLQTPHGTLHYMYHPFFRGYWENYAVCLDPSNISYRYLSESDTFLMQGIQGNDEDKYAEGYVTEAGLQVRHEQTNAILKLY